MTDKAIQKGYTKRYLPEKAWASLSKEEILSVQKKQDVLPEDIRILRKNNVYF
jgi:hypothetical protein